jgi:N-acyl-D-aspartate/D-glutamate deacylase
MDGTPLIIRNGLVIDGSGNLPVIADVLIQDGVICEVGKIPHDVAQTIDARGFIVTPGFVDIHTHYDGQATWSQYLRSSSELGVTTAVMGNCGVGLAPCSPENRTSLVTLMEGIEDIPGVVLNEGLPWSWQSFEQYLDALESRRYDIDIAAQIGHAPLRIEVMGQRAKAHAPATDEDCQRMAALVKGAIQAGALGFTTSRTLVHKGSDGQHTPSLGASAKELLKIAGALRELNQGVIQLITDFEDVQAEFALMRALCEESKRPLSFTLLQHEHRALRWREVLSLLHKATAQGLPMKAQVGARSVALILGLGLSMCPFSGLPAYEALKDLPVPERLHRLRDPKVKAKILSQAHADPVLARRVANFENMYVLGDPPDYEPRPEDSLAAMAAREGATAAAFTYDLLASGDGETLLYRPLYNYADQSLDAVREMLMDPDTIVGLSDGGAHYGYICDASFPLYLMTHWGRDRTRGERIPLEQLVKWQTADAAAAVGLHDRGMIAPGFKADLNILDFDRLRLHKPHIAHDLPAGGRRLAQSAQGIVATLVSGVVTYREGVSTGHLPGRLIRGARPGPRRST